MGFRLNRTYALRFQGDLAGLEVDIAATSVGVVLKLRETSMGDSAAFAGMLAEHVTHWNYEDEKGEVLPICVESFLELEEPVLALIVKEWYKAAVGVTAPLDEGSTLGQLVASIPMEPQ
jgi:hypothetical protein